MNPIPADWQLLPDENINPLSLVPVQDPYSGGTIRFEMIHHILAPADLVCGVWIERDPLPPYKSAERSMRIRTGKRDAWAIQLLPRNSATQEAPAADRREEEEGGQPPSYRPFHRGLVIFRAVRPHICRLTVSLEFLAPTDEAAQWALADEVTGLETTVNQFALKITSEVEETAVLGHAIFV